MPTFPVFDLDKPALRALEIIPVQEARGVYMLVRDPLGVIPEPVAMAADLVLLFLLQHLNGQHTVEEIGTKARLQLGPGVTDELLREVIRQLDEALLLLSPRFTEAYEARKRDYKNEPLRKMLAFRADDRLVMLKQLGEEFRRHLKGADAPPERLDLGGARVRAVLAPHIDFARGGHAYAWAYKALKDHSSAKTFVILGTVHRPTTHRFIATPKDFETPWGNVETDREMLAEFQKEFTGELFEDEWIHSVETTIELQVVYLKQLYQDRPFRILPILVGSFEDLLIDGAKPTDDPEIAQFIAALSSLLERHGEDVVLVGGVDFSHCGPEFGDEVQNDDARMKEIETADRAALEAIEKGDAAAFFESFRADLNDRKVCSIAPIYALLSALGGKSPGRVLKYQQANSDDKNCMVTFASVAFTDGAAEEKPKSRIILL